MLAMPACTDFRCSQFTGAVLRVQGSSVASAVAAGAASLASGAASIVMPTVRQAGLVRPVGSDCRWRCRGDGHGFVCRVRATQPTDPLAIAQAVAGTATSVFTQLVSPKGRSGGTPPPPHGGYYADGEVVHYDGESFRVVDDMNMAPRPPATHASARDGDNAHDGGSANVPDSNAPPQQGGECEGGVGGEKH